MLDGVDAQGDSVLRLLGRDNGDPHLDLVFVPKAFCSTLQLGEGREGGVRGENHVILCT